MLFLVIAIHLIIDCPIMSSEEDGLRNRFILHAVPCVDAHRFFRTVIIRVEDDFDDVSRSSFKQVK